MELRPITLQEDKSHELYASDDCQNLLAMYEKFYPKIGYHFPWVGYFIELPDKIVGTCGFVGQPKDNKVEIAYWTFKDYEGKGIASLGCKALLNIVYKEDPRLTITAKTAPEKKASTRILEKNSFEFSGLVQDEEIGDA